MNAAEVAAWLVDRVASITGIASIDPARPLQEYGLSSRDTVRLVAELGDHVGRVLPTTFGYQHPSIAALAAASLNNVEQSHKGIAGLLNNGTIAPGEPVAVVGVGCRLPGGIESPIAFWDLLDQGADVIGTRESTPGGYLDDVAGFDAAFFGITPREAAVMDPQQRIVLEVAWAALEHAGIAPSSLHGSRTGVYMGVSATEYGSLTMADPDAVDAWSATGAAASIVANRLSYLLDLRGPSVVVDTACSSSLVAVHQAVQGLRHGDADLAVVGGVNLLLTPGVTATFQRAGVLAADGRCKAFDAAADGIVRGEGCGVVVLRRLTDARRAGDRVLAVIRGSAVNSDGRSNGLMAPSPDAQAALLAAAYPAADTDPSTVDYVEAHGTGTLLGDPIEATALGAVLGAGRAGDRPLLVGSVKTNLGHLEGAAGIVGLIKVVLAMANDRIPASLHYREANPHIDFPGLGLRVVSEPTTWPRYSGLASAGVSAFGFGGSNAHVVVEEWPSAAAVVEPDTDQPEAFVLSAATAEAVRSRAADLADWLDTDRSTALADVAGALATRRDHLPARAAVVATGRSALVAGLRAFATGAATPATVVSATATGADPVFVFSGYGSSWPGMGKGLLMEPAFAAAVDALEPLFAAEAGFSLREAISDGEPADLTVAGPTLFGTQVALAELWRAHGVTPAAVVGHSVGEVAAAVVAGALDVEQGLRVVVARSALLAEVDASGTGAMAVVELSDAEFISVADQFPGVGVAVHASPSQLTVAGPPDQVAALVSYVDGMGRLARTLDVGGAGHSAAVDPYLDGFRAALDGLTPTAATVPVFSSVGDGPFDVDYWVANLRQPVRFAQAVTAAIGAGHRCFLEISPHPIAIAAIERTADVPVIALPTLRRGSGVEAWLSAAATLYAHGNAAAIVARHPAAPVVDLPGPVWRHERHWVAAPAPTDRHPLLGDHVELPEDGRHVWQADLGAHPLPWLADHRAYGVVVLPGTAYLELALAAARVALGTSRVTITGLTFAEFLAPGPDTTLTTMVDRDGRVTISSRGADGGWITHATATVLPDDNAPIVPCSEPENGTRIDLYGALAAAGQEYGPAFRGLSGVVATPGRACASVRLPAEAGGHRRFAVHPALSDACLQTLVGAALGLPGVHGRYVPTSIGRARVFGDPSTGVRCVATLRPDGASLLGAVHLLDLDGAVLVELSDVRASALGQAPGGWTELAVERRWDLAPLPAPRPGRRSWTVVGSYPGLVEALEGDELRDEGADGVVVIADPTDPEALLLSVARIAASLADSRLWVVTDGSASWLRGLIRVLAFEHPSLRATLLEVDAASGARAIAAELRADRPDDEVRWRDGRRLRARLARAHVSPAVSLPIRDGAYLITGGLGELGARVAGWLAESGATRIVLTGRTARPAPAGVEVILGDIADPGFAERAVAFASRDGIPLRGVVHAAGVLDDHTVATLTAEDIARVWRPKVLGGQRLHEATAAVELDWWVVFSSIAALVGSPGQAAYATANAWLDGLVDSRRAAGLPGVTINWGAWQSQAVRANAALAELSPSEGLDALAGLLAGNRTGIGVAHLDAARTLALFPELAQRPFLAGFTGKPDPVAATVPLASRDALLNHLATVVENLIGVVDRTAPLTSLGLDSLMAVRLRTAIERDLGTTPPVPLLLRSASVSEIAEHLANELDLPAVSSSVVSVGPRDAAERWVAFVWGEVLGSAPEGVHLDFPGDLAEAQRVYEAMGDRLPDLPSAETLFATPTVAAMADLVRDLLDGQPNEIVKVLRSDGDGVPLMLFHPAGGPTSVYHPLVAELPDGYPVYGFERLDEESTVEGKARRYVELIREIQPHGPYWLGGWSFGGCLAYEVAHTLTEQGETVAQVVMIDTILPRPSEAEPEQVLLDRFARFAAYIEETYDVSLGLSIDELATLEEGEQITFVMSRLATIPAIGDAVLKHQYASYVDARVAERYRPRPYAGPVLLARATEPPPLTSSLDPRYLRADDALGWDGLCADLRIAKVPGNHLTIIDPPAVATLAEAVAATEVRHG
ncbi:beta-ketoacyl synthase N-terminal-like domain-containing protein [Actinokineospora sp. HUAS TT18]|uniref:beta-ketoacyl synthase N-terminal-like domain-containing protein n=1 Tax=Actinokineospora sp. HUAS TT18 TaxID=3447451 RepID=UPI003F5207F9